MTVSEDDNDRSARLIQRVERHTGKLRVPEPLCRDHPTHHIRWHRLAMGLKLHLFADFLFLFGQRRIQTEHRGISLKLRGRSGLKNCAQRFTGNSRTEDLRLWRGGEDRIIHPEVRPA